jgi:hypothetical protein
MVLAYDSKPVALKASPLLGRPMTITAFSKQFELVSLALS